jgi:hypothetical protein
MGTDSDLFEPNAVLPQITQMAQIPILRHGFICVHLRYLRLKLLRFLCGLL